MERSAIRDSAVPHIRRPRIALRSIRATRGGDPPSLLVGGDDMVSGVT